MGGKDPSDKSISSTEVIGLDSCSVPDLPEERYNHGSFMTEWGSLAVCGGWWAGKPWSSDCLVLNTTSKQWERGILGAVLGEDVLGVITMDVGTYMVHQLTSSFLPSGERDWIGLDFPYGKLHFQNVITAFFVRVKNLAANQR